MDHLPVEIVLQILSFLPVADLIHVSCVSKRFWEVAGDLQLIRHLDFRQAYTCTQEDVKAFLQSPKRCCSVHILNMDAVYWFKPPLTTIARMKKLESLHLRGINLTFRQLHGLLTAGLLLQELSVDWPMCDPQPLKMIEEMQEGVRHLKFLCLTCQTVTMVTTLLKQCTGPLRLIVYCKSLRRCYPLSGRHDIFLAHKPACLDWEILWRDWLKMPYQHFPDVDPSSACQVSEMVYSNMETTFTLQSFPALKALQILDTPGQLLDLNGIFSAFPNLERLRLDIRLSEKENIGIFNLVSSLQHLTHLSLPVYVLCDTSGTKETYTASAPPREIYSQNFKRQRLGAASSEEDVEDGALNLIIDSCPLLIMLEIGLEENVKSVRLDDEWIPGETWGRYIMGTQVLHLQWVLVLHSLKGQSDRDEHCSLAVLHIPPTLPYQKKGF